MKIGELNNKIQERLELDKQLLTEAVKHTLQDLHQNLNASVQNVLATTEDAMRQRSEKLCQTLDTSLTALEERSRLLNRSVWKVFAFHFLGASAVLLGLAVGAWGMAHWWKQEVKQLQEQVGQLTARHQYLAQDLELLEKKTWGVSLHKDKEGMFVIFPQGTDMKNIWTVGKRPALKLEK